MSEQSTRERWYHRFVTADPRAEADFGGTDRVSRGGLRLIGANALQSIGDQVVNAKTVLPWLLALVGAPAALVGLLVPVREAGSMLPQAALTPWVVARPRRTRVWMLGAAGQAGATAAMAAAALALDGWVAGAAVLAALAVFALARCLCSMAAKDVQGRTVPKGQRGQVTGAATMVSGAAALVLGVALQLLGPGLDAPALAAFLLGAALMWALAVLVYAGIPEEAREPQQERQRWWADTVGLLRDDAGFRRFVLARGLLLVSALAPPFLVTLAVDAGRSGGQGEIAALLGGLGSFVIAQGAASVVGGRVFGSLADRSSRLVMVLGALVASLVVLLAVAAVLALPGRPGALLAALVTAYLVLSLVHVGVRVARKTYVVDLAEGDRRTRYVAVSNTAMGVVLLVTGGVSAALATLGAVAALVFLAVLGLVGAAVSWRLPEVSRG
ncbi:MFS transporter [uncultured Serinicoccus sp.]|uniref:MFS transporter n=1 Tax=uncultured Serinicoccus sp. TaxID=735514 RepID=UPI0026370E66|nr:MFS transporter [uncultured Serinicoccus sp.]